MVLPETASEILYTLLPSVVRGDLVREFRALFEAAVRERGREGGV